MAAFTTPVMHLYCEQRGYQFLPFKNRFHLDAVPNKFLNYGDRMKIQLYKDLYDDFDCIVWLDVDVLITNMEIKIEDLMGDRPFLWTYCPSGPLSGFTLARTIPSTLLWLHSVQHFAAEKVSTLDPTGWSDQNAMRHLMHLPPYAEVASNIVSCKEAGHCFPADQYGWEQWAAMCDWEPGDFLFTVPSLPLDWRLGLMGIKRQMLYGE